MVWRLIILISLALVILRAATSGWRFQERERFIPTKEDYRMVERLKAHVHKLAQEIGERSVFKYEKLDAALEYITQTFASFGYNVEFQDYTLLDKTVKNIMVTKEGKQRPEEIIIVGAHYDSCFNPGADDNASSVAGLLELARAMRDIETARTVKFIAFVNEEPPFFKSGNMGSRVYTRQARERRENIQAAIILEMIGYYSDKPHSQRYPPLFGLFYPDRGNFIAVVGNFPSRWLVKKVVSAFKRKTQFPIESVVSAGFVPGVDFSDNWSFWQEGYPAVMITDTGFYRNPHYHTNADTYEKLDYRSMAEVVKGLGAVLLELAN